MPTLKTKNFLIYLQLQQMPHFPINQVVQLMTRRESILSRYLNLHLDQMAFALSRSLAFHCGSKTLIPWNPHIVPAFCPSHSDMTTARVPDYRPFSLLHPLSSTGKSQLIQANVHIAPSHVIPLGTGDTEMN